ncbi:MAG TPA: uroporphyrinogen-III C-methyltransferase [Casimicrobiaceae bacterium]|nr:uroporphyrinogen-III C-methyltransferase [Casimicrobiaceae bacterium]
MGTVFLVGAGPGAVDLLTLRAARLLARADIVFHDALVEPAVLDLTVRAEKVAVGKRCGAHSTSQRFINKRLIDAARRFDCVVRLKGGDPMLFGRAQEEIDALTSAGVEVQVVPGVTAALAAAAECNLSLTRRGVARSVTFVTPRVGDDQTAHGWAEGAARADTAVIYMGAGDAAAVASALMARGTSPRTPIVLVENASRANARRSGATLADLPRIAANRGDGPAVIIVGEIASKWVADALETRATGTG